MLAPRGTDQQTTTPAGELLAELVDAAGTAKVQVWRRPRGDASGLELVQLLWGSGVGWYVQQRLALDERQADSLRALATSLPAAPEEPVSGFRGDVGVEVDGNVIRLRFSEPRSHV